MAMVTILARDLPMLMLIMDTDMATMDMEDMVTTDMDMDMAMAMVTILARDLPMLMLIMDTDMVTTDMDMDMDPDMVMDMVIMDTTVKISIKLIFNLICGARVL